MKSRFEPIGKCIKMTNEKNKGNNIDLLLGINISKNFMPSVANVSETDLSKYRVIRKGHFACNIMHVGRDERLPISLYNSDSPAIVSPAYKTFEVVDTEILLPEFLMMFFKRESFDHLAWYLCDSSVRGGLDWNRFCEIKMPLPEIEEQKKYVAVYRFLETKRVLDDKLREVTKPLCPALIQGVIKDLKNQEAQAE